MSKITTVGDRVKLKYKTKELVGIVKFAGSIKGKNGTYYGIELDKANTGDNNGDYKNITYFTSARKKGIFVKKSAITKTSSKNNTAPRVTVGSNVDVTKSNCVGCIKFIGELESKAGIYYGIQLKESKGKNNGTFKGRSYFECDEHSGVFVKENGFETINSKISYNIKPKTKKSNTNSAKKISQSSTILSDSEAIDSNDTNRRQDIEKVVNVLNGVGSANDLNAVIASYDDKKENEDMEWLKILATLQIINDNKNKSNVENNELKQEINKLKNEKNNINTSVDDNSQELKVEINKLREQIIELKHDQNKNENEYKSKTSALKQQIVTLKNNIILKADITVPEDKDNVELERRLKFEKEETKRKYESQIKTLQADKQRLERQVLKSRVSPSPSHTPTSTNHNEQKQTDDDAKNGYVDVEQLQKDKEQLQIVIRAKDEIIQNAKAEIMALKKEISIMKEEDEKEEVQLDRLSKDRAKKLLQERVSDQQQGSLTGVTKLAQKKKTISELLNESTKEDAVSIIHSMGVMKFEYDKKLQADTYNLDLTNNSVLRRLTNDHRVQFMFLLAHCICDSSGQQKVEKVKMSNMGIDDKLFPDFFDILIENIEYFGADEFWLESNKMGDEGMKKFAQFLGGNPATLEVVKMYNNKAIVSTPVINQLLSSIETNDKLQKFTFQWRLTQHRDRIEKQLKKNQDLKRKLKWAGKSK